MKKLTPSNLYAVEVTINIVQPFVPNNGQPFFGFHKIRMGINAPLTERKHPFKIQKIIKPKILVRENSRGSTVKINKNFSKNYFLEQPLSKHLGSPHSFRGPGANWALKCFRLPLRFYN